MTTLLALYLIIVPWFTPGSTLRIMNPFSSSVTYTYNGSVRTIEPRSFEEFTTTAPGFVVIESSLKLSAYANVEGAFFVGQEPDALLVSCVVTGDTGIVLINPSENQVVSRVWIGDDIKSVSLAPKSGAIFFVGNAFGKIAESVMIVSSTEPIVLGAAKPVNGKWETIPVMSLK
jgi:hypothetical protein